MVSGLQFSEIAYDYYDRNSNYLQERKDRMSEVEKDEDYLYARGIYLASSLLYDLIKDQYPEKYRGIYTRLVRLRKSEV